MNNEDKIIIETYSGNEYTAMARFEKTLYCARLKDIFQYPKFMFRVDGLSAISS